MSPRHVLRGGLSLLGNRAGRGGGQWVRGLLRAGGLCDFYVRPWAARVVPPLLRCALRVLAVWGLWGRLSPPLLRRPWVGRRLPRPRVRGVWSPRQRVGR